MDPQALLNAITRHQIYVEGLKEGQFAYITPALIAAEQDIRMILVKSDNQDLSSMTKAKLGKLARQLVAAFRNRFDPMIEGFLRFLRQYLETDRELLPPVIQANSDAPIVGALATTDVIWSQIKNDPLGANGLTMMTILAGLSASAAALLQALVFKTWANAETTQALINQIQGTRRLGYKDGIMNTIFNSAKGSLATVLQHVAAGIRDKVTALFTDTYMWSSIIDGVTTDICRHRNGKIYRRGSGPLPPAHWNCRSSTIPIFFRQPIPQIPSSFFDWLKNEPDDFVQDILRRRMADVLRSKEARRSDFPKFQDPYPLTLDQYRGKTSLITTGTRG